MHNSGLTPNLIKKSWTDSIKELFRLSSFRGRDTTFESFLATNQYSWRKQLYFVSWCGSKFKNPTFKVNFLCQKVLLILPFSFHWWYQIRCSFFVIDIFCRLQFFKTLFLKWYHLFDDLLLYQFTKYNKFLF